MLLLALLLGLLTAVTAVDDQSPSTAGLVSIDCGVDDVSNYADKNNGLVYSSDKPYTSTGVNKKVSSDTNLTSFEIYYATALSFPDGIRNCRTLGPVISGAKFRMLAEFLHGNYNGLRRSPTLDLYHGVNFWETMEAEELNRPEIITVVETDSIHVCLVNIGKGTPFVSELDLRRLPFSTYSLLNDSLYWVVFHNGRINYGAGDQITSLSLFPDDIYHRRWNSTTLGKNMSIPQIVNLQNTGEFPIPPALLQTTAVGEPLSDNLSITTSGSAEQAIFVYMYLAELQELESNERSEFNIYEEDKLFADPIRPGFLQDVVVHTLPPGRPGGMTYYSRATSNATVPPIINDIKIFRLLKMPSMPTNGGDVRGISDLKKLLRVSGNWEADPCVPREFSWKGLEYGYTAFIRFLALIFTVKEGSGRRKTLMTPALFLALLLGLLAATTSAQETSTAGFISIDCGLNVSKFTDTTSGLVYSWDEPYISTGVNMVISTDTSLTSLKDYYADVRSFPDGVRNCYTLGPVLPGSKCRVTAEFMYGNYDGLRKPPTFDLYLGVNLWATVETGDFDRTEIVTVTATDSIQVCLVNTGNGTPFISVLMLRPLPFSMYNIVNDALYSIVFDTDRKNYGALDQIEFPDDIYDRLWDYMSLWKSINTTSGVQLMESGRFPMPQAVLQTAAVGEFLSDTLNITTYGSAEQAIFVYMYFAELQELASNETREFNIYAGDELFAGPIRPEFLQDVVVHTLPPGGQGGMTYSIRATSNATVPPIINAIEIFRLLEMPSMRTIGGEVTAISDLKKLLRVSRNWEGDPCVPREFKWEGLECGYTSSNYSMITSLDLSGSGLSGIIPLYIANLTNLKSLDLSNNNFTGEIPAYLGELPTLKSINLEDNNLNGTIPQTIHERSQNGSLTLRINNNPVLCSTVDLCNGATTKNTKVIVPISIAVSVAALLLFAGVIAACTFKRRKTLKRQKGNQGKSNVREKDRGARPQLVFTKGGLHSESPQFSESDITSITNNFERPIGRGGFGTVYHGCLKDGTQVAVKVLSRSSAQGEKQFRAEAELLTRVHHKYLVSLLGYCNENMALVYEFVPLGSLADHLSGNRGDKSILSWTIRLQIALEAAQGLDYLHNGCKPPIVHRDVKTSNILLTEKFEVKFADFGLSRSFDIETNTYASTVVAGTPGYLDPDYQETYKLTERSDVYSFGIVLLELVTGKPPISNDANRTHITSELRSSIERGDLTCIADPKMQGHYAVNSMWRVIEIALSCTADDSSQRPTISDVAAQLRECLGTESSKELPGHISTRTCSPFSDNLLVGEGPSAR